MSATPPSSLPPPAGTSAGNGKYVAIGLVLLLLVGGAIAFKLRSSDTSGTAPTATVSIPPPIPRPKPDDDIPPPPVVEVKPDAGPAAVVKTTGTAVTGCEPKTCTGSSSDELNAALAARARLARKCYEQALANDAELQGKLAVQVRIGTTGASCNASIKQDDLHSPSVAACVTNYFRNGSFPAPKGGCVEATVPLNFVKR